MTTPHSQPLEPKLSPRRERLIETTLELLAFDTQNLPGTTRELFLWLRDRPEAKTLSSSGSNVRRRISRLSPCDRWRGPPRLTDVVRVSDGEYGSTRRRVDRQQCPPAGDGGIDVRLTPGAAAATILERFQQCLQTRPAVTISGASWTDGTYVELSAPFVTAVADTARKRWDQRVFRYCVTGGVVVKKLRTAGIPAVECAIGSDTAHGVDEYIPIDTLERTAEWYIRLPWTLASSPDR